MIIIKYETEEEAQQIIQTKQAEGFVLIAVSNVTEGNFLGFDDSTPTPVDPALEVRLTGLKEDNLILMDVLATMYEDMLAKGTV